MHRNVHTLGQKSATLVTRLAEAGQYCFTTREAAAVLGEPVRNVSKLLSDLRRRRWVAPVERGKYLLLPLEAGGEASYSINELVLASKLVSPYYASRSGRPFITMDIQSRYPGRFSSPRRDGREASGSPVAGSSLSNSHSTSSLATGRFGWALTAFTWLRRRNFSWTALTYLSIPAESSKSPNSCGVPGIPWIGVECSSTAPGCATGRSANGWASCSSFSRFAPTWSSDSSHPSAPGTLYWIQRSPSLARIHAGGACRSMFGSRKSLPGDCHRMIRRAEVRRKASEKVSRRGPSSTTTV